MGFSTGQENGCRRFLAEVDNAGQFPLICVECKGKQLIPTMAGDSASKAEVSGYWYFEFHCEGILAILWFVWFTFGQAET